MGGHLLILCKLKLPTLHCRERRPRPLPPAASSRLFLLLTLLKLRGFVEGRVQGGFSLHKNVNFTGGLCLRRSAKRPEGGARQQAPNEKVQQGKSCAL